MWSSKGGASGSRFIHTQASHSATGTVRSPTRSWPGQPPQNSSASSTKVLAPSGDHDHPWNGHTSRLLARVPVPSASCVPGGGRRCGTP